MEENLPQSQITVNPVPASAPPSPKKFPLNLILIILIFIAIFSAGAYIVIKNQSNKQPPPPTPTVQPSQISPSPTIDETSNWKTYRDEKYSFQFLYPQDLFLKKSEKFPDSIFLTKYDIDIENGQNEGPFALISIMIWDKNDFLEPLNLLGLDKRENIMVDGVKAVKVSGIKPEGQYLAGIYYQQVFFSINDKIISLLFYEDPSNNIKLLDQILSTFKFLDNEEEFNNKFKENRASARDIMRKSDLTVLLSTIYLYSQDNQGNIPSKISEQVQFIRTGEADICSNLIPKYFPAMPQDPSVSDLTKRFKSCSENYDTGYTVIKDPSTGKITLGAPFAEQGLISVTK